MCLPRVTLGKPLTGHAVKLGNLVKNGPVAPATGPFAVRLPLPTMNPFKAQAQATESIQRAEATIDRVAERAMLAFGLVTIVAVVALLIAAYAVGREA